MDVKRLQNMLLTPGHNGCIDEVEHSQGNEKQGQSPSEVAPEAPVPEVYHKSCQLVI